MKRNLAPLFKAISILMVLFLITSESARANHNVNHQTLLTEIVSTVVQIMRKNGYEMPDYRVVDGHTDVPILGPPQKHAFFGYVDKKWMNGSAKIILVFYEADLLPFAGRIQVINYLLRLHEEKRGDFALRLYMTNAKYKKPQLTIPEAYLEINLNPIAH